MAVIEVNGNQVPITGGRTVLDTMIVAGYAPDAFLYMVEGRPVPSDSVFVGDETVRAIKVASGG